MNAWDRLNSTQQLERKGMARTQAETVAKATKPLTTKEDLRQTEAQLRKEMQAMEARLDNKIGSLRKDMAADLKLHREQTKTEIQSLKLWLVSGLLAIALSNAVF